MWELRDLKPLIPKPGLKMPLKTFCHPRKVSCAFWQSAPSLLLSQPLATTGLISVTKLLESLGLQLSRLVSSIKHNDVIAHVNSLFLY